MIHMIQGNMTMWLQGLGVLGIILIIFAETGIIFCFFLPGDTLLFTAGILASKDVLHLGWLLSGTILAAIAGYELAYRLGARIGSWLEKRGDTWYYKKSYIEKSHSFYEKHGGKSIMLGRFVPVVRSFAPVVAGIAEMRYRRYLFFNVLGAFIWVGGIALTGFFLGDKIPFPHQLILPVMLAVVVISFLPAIWHLLKEKRRSEMRKQIDND